MRKVLCTALGLLSLAVAIYTSDYLDRTVKLPISYQELGYRYLALLAYTAALLTGFVASIEIFKTNNNDNTTNTTGV